MAKKGTVTRNVMGEIYTIENQCLKSQHLDGYCNTLEKKIVIDKSLKGTARMQTEIHELGHAIFCRTALVQTDISLNLQEIICDTFATVMTENYRLTPKKV